MYLLNLIDFVINIFDLFVYLGKNDLKRCFIWLVGALFEMYNSSHIQSCFVSPCVQYLRQAKVQFYCTGAKLDFVLTINEVFFFSFCWTF